MRLETSMATNGGNFVQGEISNVLNIACDDALAPPVAMGLLQDM